MDKSELILKIKTAWPTYDDAQFKEIVSEVLGGNFIERRRLADEVRVSQLSLGRWASGKNLPHPAMRLPICKTIFRLLTDGENP